MRPYRLARIAAEAEGVRLKGMVSRIVTRVVFGLVAFFFVLAMLTCGHFAAWYEVRVGLDLSFLTSTGVVGGIDLVLAVIFGLLARRSSPSRVELEAREVRRKAIEGIGSALTLTQMAVPVLRLVSNFGRTKRI